MGAFFMKFEGDSLLKFGAVGNKSLLNICCGFTLQSFFVL